MNEFSKQNRLASKELEARDVKSLRRAQQIGLVGLIFVTAGATGIVASREQVSWDIDKIIYLVLLATGSLGLLYAARNFRKLMKKYLRSFSFFS